MNVSDEFRKIPTAKLLQRVAEARDAGELDRVRGEWWACIARARARVEFQVDKAIHVKRLFPASERDDVVQKALERGARRLIQTLDDLSEGAFFAAMIKVAIFTCQDEGRAHVARDKHRGRSLDEAVGDEDGQTLQDHLTEKQARREWDEVTTAGEYGEVIKRALGELSERERFVILAWQGGISDDGVAEHLQTSPNNVQQIRSRTLRKLSKNTELRGLIEP